MPSGGTQDDTPSLGQDVFVPWVLTSQTPKAKTKARSKDGDRIPGHSEISESQREAGRGQPKVFNRYYHMFAKGELATLVHEAAESLGLEVGPKPEGTAGGGRRTGLTIVEDGWERSNYYVEFRRWQS